MSIGRMIGKTPGLSDDEKAVLYAAAAFSHSMRRFDLTPKWDMKNWRSEFNNLCGITNVILPSEIKNYLPPDMPLSEEEIISCFKSLAEKRLCLFQKAEDDRGPATFPQLVFKSFKL